MAIFCCLLRSVPCSSPHQPDRCGAGSACYDQSSACAEPSILSAPPPLRPSRRLYERTSPNWAGKAIVSSLVLGAACAPPPVVSAGAAPSLVAAAAAAPALRALSIMEAFIKGAEVLPNDSAVNQCLQLVADRICPHMARPRGDAQAVAAWLADGRRRLRRARATLEAASAMGATLARDTHLRLVLAAERCCDPAGGVAECKLLKRHGASPPPEVVRSLLDQAVANGAVPTWPRGLAAWLVLALPRSSNERLSSLNQNFAARFFAGDEASVLWLSAELQINPPKPATSFGSGEESALGHYVFEASPPPSTSQSTTGPGGGGAAGGGGSRD